jgi:hypothetical protein
MAGIKNWKSGKLIAPRRIGFVSTRFAGTDGVSLESAKWAQVLAEDQHQCFWYAGRLDKPPATSCCVPEAFLLILRTSGSASASGRAPRASRWSRSGS